MIKINISAIVAEYNPLHLGHKYQISETIKEAEAEGLIAVMSGNFTQRGNPSLIDKWNRTKMALNAGIDLVIELPCVYSLSSAEFFSFGAVSLINGLNVVDHLSFGSECGDIEIITQIANIIATEPEEYKILLKKYLKEGLSFPLSRSKALITYMNSKDIFIKDILNSSNNILAFEYCRALNKLKSSIKPLTIKRIGEDYNSDKISQGFLSATGIRNYIRSNTDITKLEKLLPEYSYKLIKDLSDNSYDFVFERDIYPFLKYKILTDFNNINKLPDIREGLENRIYESLLKSSSYEELINTIKNKRYTYTRISRILCQFFIGFENHDIKNLRTAPCPYGRILGFNDKGRRILKEIKKNSNIPLITKVKECHSEVMDIELQSTKAYSLLNKNVGPIEDYIRKPIYWK